MRRGLFGGTFDPPHIGHLIVAQDAAEALGLDRVVFLPAGVPPHKRDQDVTPAGIRVELVTAATRDDPRFAVDARETRREGPSYTVDTLRELRADTGEGDLVLLLGADQYAEFATWKDPEGIRRLCTVAVLDRDGRAVALDARDVRVSVTRIDISSSELRERVRGGRSIRYLVPAGVAECIAAHGLYGSVPVGENRNDAAAPV